MKQLKINKNITNRESASLDKYLQEVAKEDLISTFDEVDLAQRIRAGDQQALEKLVKANLRFVISVAKQYQNQGLMLPDLISEGNLGLIKAAQKFDESRGFKFISYAVWRIRQSILQALAGQARMIRLPFNKIGQAQKIAKASIKLEQIYNREPTADEIAEILELNEDIVRDVLEIQTKAVSLDKPIESNENHGNLLDLIESNDFEKPDANLDNEALKFEINRSLATLTPREKIIVEYFFGLHTDSPQGLTLEEIGEKFGLTRERARQIKEKAIRRLKHTSRSKQLKQYLEG